MMLNGVYLRIADSNYPAGSGDYYKTYVIVDDEFNDGRCRITTKIEVISKGDHHTFLKTENYPTTPFHIVRYYQKVTDPKTITMIKMIAV